jgi:hypothetical protein
MRGSADGFFDSARRQPKLTVGLLLIIAICIAAMAWFQQEVVNHGPPRSDPSSLDTFVARYGPPDADESTEHDVPRPPIVTRRIVYKRAGVAAVYVPNAPMNYAPPYDSWRLLGYQESITNKVLSLADVRHRMRAAGRGDDTPSTEEAAAEAELLKEAIASVQRAQLYFSAKGRTSSAPVKDVVAYFEATHATDLPTTKRAAWHAERLVLEAT